MDRFDSAPEVRNALLELADEACLTLAVDGCIRSFSSSLARLFGREADDLVGVAIDTLLPGFDPTRQIAAGHGGGTGAVGPLEDVAAQVEAQHKDGRNFAAQIRMRPVVARGERLFVLIVQPIGATEDGLRESQEMLRAVVDSTTACIYIKDAEGRYILINRRFEELFHLSNDWIRGKKDDDFLPPEIAGSLRENDVVVQRDGVAMEFDETVPSDGALHQYLSIKVPLIDPSGAVYAVCGISTDITDRKRREEQLVETYRQLQGLVADHTSDLTELNRLLREETAAREDVVLQLSGLIAAANEGIWTVDVRGLTTFVNPRMAELLGQEGDGMLGRPMFEFLSGSEGPELAQELLSEIHGAQYEIELRRRDGSSAWALMSTSPIRDRRGQLAGALCMLTDITDRKHAEEYRIQVVRELDHRVKNSLATVVALADLILANSSSLGEFRFAFGERMQALARTHEALADARWQDIAFDSVVDVVLKAQQAVAPGRISTSGDAVQLAPRVVTPLALTLSELGTNALKHGALSQRGGEVRVAWTHREDDRFELIWTERGGPAVAPPAAEGTGLELVRGLIEHELGGVVALDFAGQGLCCRIEIPLAGGRAQLRGGHEPDGRGHAARDPL